jgi:hypothetical protein
LHRVYNLTAYKCRLGGSASWKFQGLYRVFFLHRNDMSLACHWGIPEGLPHKLTPTFLCHCFPTNVLSLCSVLHGSTNVSITTVIVPVLKYTCRNDKRKGHNTVVLRPVSTFISFVMPTTRKLFQSLHLSRNHSNTRLVHYAYMRGASRK